MDLNQLRYFIVVAETENITKASQKLYITQPALSRAIGRLEAELDVKLFDRSTNALLLNENGKLFLKYVTMGLDAIHSGVEALGRRNANRQIHVANYVFLDSFASFCDRSLSRFPDVDLVSFDGSRSASDYPTDISPDIAVIPEQNYRDYRVVCSYREPWCVMFHQDYQFRSDCDGKSLTLDQLYQESIIFDNSPYDRELIINLFGDIPPNLKFANRDDSTRIAINRRQAVGIVPILAFMSLKKRVPDSPVVALQLRGNGLERKVYLSHKPTFPDVPQDMEVLELLEKHIALEYEEAAEFAARYFAL